MRLAFFLGVLAATSASIVIAACSSDTPETTPGGDGSVVTTNEASTGSDASTDGPSGEGSGLEYAPTGCLLKTTDYISGTKAENIPTAGQADWTNVKGALSEDGDFATVTMNADQQSAELRVSEFGLKIPDTAETWGIEVELKRRAPDGGVYDDKVDVLIEGKTTQFKYVGTPWPVSIVGTHHYGQSVDTWGVDLNPNDVNGSTFAARLTIKRAGDAGQEPITAVVDSLKVAVHYCPNPIKK